MGDCIEICEDGLNIVVCVDLIVCVLYSCFSLCDRHKWTVNYKPGLRFSGMRLMRKDDN